MSALEILRSRYPNDLLSSENETAKCLDCDRAFNMTSKTGKPVMRNLEQHLNGKAHQDKVAGRISKVLKKGMINEPPFSSLFQCAKPNFADFPDPEPIPCFSLPSIPGSPSLSSGEPNLKHLRGMMNQYMDAFENDTATRSMRTTFLERRQIESERVQEEMFEKLKESLIESEEKSKAMCSELEESLASHKHENKEQAQRMEDMLLEVRQKNVGHGSLLGQLDGRLTVSDSRNHQQFDSMEERLIKSDNKYFEVMRRFTLFEETSKKDVEVLVERVDTLDERNHDLVDGALAQVTEQVSESEMRQRDSTERLLEQVASQLSDSEVHYKEQLQDMRQRFTTSEGIAKEQVDSLTRELATLKQHTKETLTPITHRLIALEEENAKQKEYIHDLESQSQLHSEELQRQRDSDEILRQSLFAQMDVHFKQTAELMEKLEREASERIQAAESASSTNIKKLEKTIKDQSEHIERFEKVLPALIEQIDSLGKYAEELADSIPERVARSTAPRPGARRQTNGPRPV